MCDIAEPDHVGNPRLAFRDPAEGVDERLSIKDPGAGDPDERFPRHGPSDPPVDNLLNGVAHGKGDNPHPSLPRKRVREIWSLRKRGRVFRMDDDLVCKGSVTQGVA